MEIEKAESGSGKQKFEHERRFNTNPRDIPTEILVGLAMDAYPISLITQCYTGGLRKPRFRKEESAAQTVYTRTRKIGSGSSRPEDEIVITPGFFLRNWKKRVCDLMKRRYHIPTEEVTVEFNIFLGPLKGYFQSEVEFSSVEEMNNFQPPAWLGLEVTNDDRYSNFNLALNGLPQEE